MRLAKAFVRRLLNRAGYEVVRTSQRTEYPRDFELDAVEIIRKVQPYTMTGAERLYAVIQAVDYVVEHNIPGSIVECGVWRGGSMMCAAYRLQELNAADRELYLFDTFEGMSAPVDADVDIHGRSAAVRMEHEVKKNEGAGWLEVSVEEVERNLLRTGYDRDRMTFVKGKVEDTIPESAPDQIALLRLDTDWYESTRHELQHLFPRLSPGGVLIIDDYGHWLGSRKATDEYFAENRIPILLNRVDYTARVAVKPW